MLGETVIVMLYEKNGGKKMNNIDFLKKNKTTILAISFFCYHVEKTKIKSSYNIT
jgi:hypothetical protein